MKEPAKRYQEAYHEYEHQNHEKRKNKLYDT